MLRPVGGRVPYSHQGYQPEQNGQHFPLLANQQSQMSNQQQAQMANQQVSVDGQSNAASGPSSGPEMSLAGVLHYLQSEWRRWERDRNEWEIERAEMRARIALLEGQRRSAENLKVDLLRRVKMLEYALRQERTKSMGSTRGPSLAPSRISAIQDEDKAVAREEKEGSPSSEGSDEGDRPKANGTKSIATSKMSVRNNTENPWKNVGAAARDPKARARSREYLKQCLQEITYLTSPGALNPLPPRPPIDLDSQEHPEEQPEEDKYRPPRKSLPEDYIPPNYEPSSSLLPNGNGVGSPEKQVQPEIHLDRPEGPPKTIESRAMAPNTTARPPHSPMPKPVALPDAEPPTEEPNEDHQMLTAIYRPDSKTAWREELQAANEKAEKARSQQAPSEQSDEEQLANLTLNVEDEETRTDADGPEKTWVTRRSLRSHLEIVRTVALDHAPGHGHLLQLVSGGDDNVVKVWSVDPESVRAPRPNAPDLEPIATFRGHTSPVTSLAISHSNGIVFSGSLDSTIRVWRLPPADHDPYATYDPSLALQTLEGHADAIWDLLLVPVVSSRPAQRLVSISADRTIRTWTQNGDSWSASASYTLEDTPTCLGAYQLDMSKVLVGFAKGMVQLWDLDAGEAIMVWQDHPEGRSQVNAILSHPTMANMTFGCEDGAIRMYDSSKSSSTPTRSVVAHSSPVTSLALSPVDPMAILTASTDCRIRVYDMEKNVFVQDLTGHRARSDEGVCGLGVIPEVAVLASAGADGVIRLWAQT